MFRFCCYKSNNPLILKMLRTCITSLLTRTLATLAVFPGVWSWATATYLPFLSNCELQENNLFFYTISSTLKIVPGTQVFRYFGLTHKHSLYARSHIFPDLSGNPTRTDMLFIPCNVKYSYTLLHTYLTTDINVTENRCYRPHW